MISLSRVRFTSSELLIVWGFVVGLVILLLESDSVRPGSAGSPPVYWPEESPVRREVSRSTLLIFLHPHCPCSRGRAAVIERIKGKGQKQTWFPVFGCPLREPERAVDAEPRR